MTRLEEIKELSLRLREVESMLVPPPTKLIVDINRWLIRAADMLDSSAVELARYQQWINDLQSGMYVNCVYCGHQYGPESEVPASMADALKEHIEHCPEHPMSKLKAELADLTIKAVDIAHEHQKSTAELAQYKQDIASGRMVVLPPFEADGYEGLKGKYFVYKARNGEPVEDCFVLRPTKDEAALHALLSYAVATKNNQLSEDLCVWIRAIAREAALEAAGKE